MPVERAEGQRWIDRFLLDCLHHFIGHTFDQRTNNALHAVTLDVTISVHGMGHNDTYDMHINED